VLSGFLTRRAAITSLLGAAACQPSTPRPKSLDNARMARFDLPGGGTALLVRYDMTKTIVDHICLEAVDQEAKVGDY
jgi:hypothetical protein